MREYNEFQDKTILVTGGAGCVGSNLTRKLADLGAEKVIILDNMSSAYHWNIPDRDAIQFVQGDILSDEDLKRVFKEKPDYVYHLAAHFANQNSVDEPETDLMVNGIGILKVLEHAQLTGVDRFIYSSSGCGVYGLESKMPFEEHDISISLHTPYQVTKLLGELYTNYFHNLYDVPIVNARFFNVFGPGEVPGKYRNVIPNFFYWAMNGQPLLCRSKGAINVGHTNKLPYIDPSYCARCNECLDSCPTYAIEYVDREEAFESFNKIKTAEIAYEILKRDMSKLSEDITHVDEILNDLLDEMTRKYQFEDYDFENTKYITDVEKGAEFGPKIKVLFPYFGVKDEIFIKIEGS